MNGLIERFSDQQAVDAEFSGIVAGLEPAVLAVSGVAEFVKPGTDYCHTSSCCVEVADMGNDYLVKSTNDPNQPQPFSRPDFGAVASSFAETF